MKEIELTNSELFKNLTEIDAKGLYFDLHNNYDCLKLSYDSGNSQMELKFKDIRNGTSGHLLTIVFEEVVFKNLQFDFLFGSDRLTIDNFYRGRFEQGNSLVEHSEDGKSFFHIEFYEDFTLELLSSKVKLFFLGS